MYVGLYGYGYLEAGKNVISLFKNRGWEAIIADDLIGNGEITSLLCGFRSSMWFSYLGVPFFLILSSVLLPERVRWVDLYR